jgi:hypothetical protein
MMGTALFSALFVLIFLASVGLQLIGHRLGTRWQPQGRGGYGGATTSITTSLFAMLGLLVAFEISGGEARLGERRHLIEQEANAIGTAYLRLDLMPDHAQPGLRAAFRRYTDSRIALFRDFDHLRLNNLEKATAEHARADELQQQIWTAATAATRSAPDPRPALLTLTAINEMIDVTALRDGALHTHVPYSLLVLLIGLGLGCSLFAGLEMAKAPHPSALHVLAFAGTLALICYVIVNVEFPRLGFGRYSLGQIDALMTAVRKTMN